MSATVVVLAHATDAGAASVARRLAARPGAPSVRWLSPEALGLAGWSQRVDADGRARTRLTPPRAEAIDSEEIRLVFNRLRVLAAPRFHRAPARDRDYATCELHALVSSWLYELGPRAVPSLHEHPWLIPVLPQLAWWDAATELGLPVVRQTWTSGPAASPGRAPFVRSVQHEPAAASREDLGSAGRVGTVLVAGASAAGPLAPRHGEACVAVCARLGLPLLEFHFADPDGEPALFHVETWPHLREPWEQEHVAAWLAREGSA